MASRIFRFYSREPEAVFRMAAERWPVSIVRRSGWKIGDSPVFYVTIVLDNFQAADEFAEWLARNAPRRDIRRYLGRAGRDIAAAVHQDVRLHGGAITSRLKLPIVTLWREIGRYWRNMLP